MIIFFFNDTATTEIYTLSLHDALPIFLTKIPPIPVGLEYETKDILHQQVLNNDVEVTVSENKLDRKSTRLNSSHANISYAVFCLKKKQFIILFSFISPPFSLPFYTHRL